MFNSPERFSVTVKPEYAEISTPEDSESCLIATAMKHCPGIVSVSIVPAIRSLNRLCMVNGIQYNLNDEANAMATVYDELHKAPEVPTRLYFSKLR